MAIFKVRLSLYAVFLGLVITLGGQTAIAQQHFDAADLLRDIRALSADEMEGRETGTAGNRRAQVYILQAFADIGLEPLGDTFFHTFLVEREDREFDGVNLVGKVSGSSDSTIVISAHYDHLGMREDGAIYNGADDNASGVAGMLALARYFVDKTNQHTLLFIAFDAEEMGLQGARAFVDNPPLPVEQISMNINLDMISRNPDDELFAVGTYHYPYLRELLEQVNERHPIHLLFGHDDPDHPDEDDWTFASDHGPFHQVGIPFIYFGVEDHPGYHDPSDTYSEITPGFYIRAVELIRDAVSHLDRELTSILVEAESGT